jgi:outer membrane protein OmpA-like peptidoglycan-associated protein
MALAKLTIRARRALFSSSLPLLAFAGAGLFAASPAYAQSVTFGAGGGTPAPAGAAPAAAVPADAAPAAVTPAGGAPAAVVAVPAAGEPAVTEVPGEGGGNSPEWRERDRQLMEASSLGGGVGLLHMQHAQGGAPGQFRMGFTSEFFSSGFLCSTTAPCPPLTTGGKTIKSDTMSHIGATLTLDATLLKWLEVYAQTGAYANSDSSNNPPLLQVLGDTTLGTKVFGGLGKVIFLGGGADLILVNGSGAVGIDGSATSAKFRVLGTADLRGLDSHVPLRFSLNGTYSLDNTGDVLAGTEAAKSNRVSVNGTLEPEPVSRIDRFGLEVNRVDHFDINLGIETFLLDERIRPMLEYGMLVPINRQGYLCVPKLAQARGDGCLATTSVVPSKITIGSRFYPWKRGFSLLAAMDIGVTGVTNFIEEVAPVAPWTLYIGAGWAIDTRERPPIEVTKMVEKPVEVLGKGAHIKGVVHEKDKDTAIANAIVAFDGHPEITSLATGADGRFTTSELSAGPYKFVIKADGYKEGICEVNLGGPAPAPAAVPANAAPAAGAAAPAAPPPPPVVPGGPLQDAQVDCPLEALPRVGNVVGHVRDAESQSPVAGASVKLLDPAGKEMRVSADSEGSFKFQNVPPGAITMEVDAEGYLALVQPATVKVRQDNNVDLAVVKKPKNPLVVIVGKEITIKQQVQFALDSAVILPESTGLMTEIADTMIKNPRITRIEVQGHTDNTGTAEHNMVLSEQRANAVRDWLTSHGVAADRLVARGYGQEKPLVPNVTPAMKAKNRRVQFIITEQTPGASVGGK